VNARSTGQGGYVFIPLFGDPQARESADLLRSRLDPAAGAACVEPPVGGMTFVASSGELSGMLDAWWESAVPADLVPVLLLLHEPGLERWVGGLDSELVIGADTDAELALYADFPTVRTVPSRDHRVVTEHVMAWYPSCFTGSAPGPRAGVPGPAPAHQRQPAGAADPSWTPFEPRARSPHGQMSPVAETAAPAQPAPQPGPARGPGFRSLLDRAGSLIPGVRRSGVPAELGALALSHQTGKIVGVTSRAGGVGKTAIAAALGIVYGEAVQESGWCAAVIDQNIGNPDQWGRLSLSTQVRTVSEIMGDIEAGREWTVPAWNRTPALAVYPERRDLGEAYAPAQIERFAGQLRQLHMISVVDLPNRIPSFTSAEAAVCAGWVAVSDLLLLPTTDDPTRLQGVLDYLEAPMVKGEGGQRPIPVIVPYVRSTLRGVRDDPRVRRTLDEIRTRVLAVVEIPKNEKATLAIVKGQPITEVDSGLRDAYVTLAMTVARALTRR
jgi:MinD-like ATPase involved in chromosome partitioning or flagellar assembly